MLAAAEASVALTVTMTPEETRAVYPDALSLREARAVYFARTGLDDRTYVEPWLKLPVGPINVWVPNVRPHREALKVHDLNHIVSGYGTDWLGESEIAAFEIGMGTGRYWMAFLADVGLLTAGLLRARQRTLRAFARGRRRATSSYRELAEVNEQDAALLDGTTVGDLRARVRVPDDAEPTAADVRAAFGYGALGALLNPVVLLGLVLVVVLVVVAVGAS